MRRRKYRDERHSRRNSLWLLRELEASGLRLPGRALAKPRDQELIPVTIDLRPPPAASLVRFFPFPHFADRPEHPSP